MLAFSELGKNDLGIPEHEDYIRELLSYDVLCPASCVFQRKEEDRSLYLMNSPSPLHWSRQFEWPWCLHHANLKPEDNVLDVGGSWSILKYALAKRCKQVISLEIDQSAIDKTVESIRRIGMKNIFQKQGDVRDIPYPDNSFDCVFCISVLEHVEDGHTKAIREMLRVLKPGGSLLLTMDIRVKGSTENNFYIDAHKLFVISNEIGFPMPVSDGKKITGAEIPDTDVVIIAVLVRMIK